MKKIMVYFDFPEATLQQYDAIWNDLRAAGHANPKGLLSHAGAEKGDGGFLVVDVWESQQAFEEFSNVLVPLIQKQNLPLGQPMILPVHYYYEKVTEMA